MDMGQVGTAVVAVLLVLSSAGIGIQGSTIAEGQQTPEIIVSDTTIGVDESDSIDVGLTGTPNGLTGYQITVSLDNPDAANITGAAIAPQFQPPPLQSATIADDNNSVVLKGTDTLRNIQSGATGISLATIEVEGQSPRETAVSVDVDLVQDDQNPPQQISPTVNEGLITVEGDNQPPNADAGSEQVVTEGEDVSLDGSSSSDPDNDSLTYTWTQTGGPSVSLTDGSTATPSFTAPDVDTAQTLTFELEVNDGNGGTDTDTVDVVVEDQPDPANFDVTIDETNSPVTEGEAATVTATIENTGDNSGTQTVDLKIDGTVEDDQSVTLDGSESQQVTLNWETEQGEAGTYDATVSSEDSSDSTEVVVEERPDPASFGVTIDETNSPVNEGEAVTVTTTIENTGDVGGTQEVTLDAGGLGTNSASVTLDSGESTTETLSVVTEAGDTGDYTATVASDNDTDNTDIAVREQSEPDEAEFVLSNLNPADATVTEGDESIDISVDIENVGDQSGEQNIELSITNESGAVVYTDTLEDVELDGGESTTATFEDAPAGNLSPGEYAHAVSSADDDIAGSLAVEETPEEADFQLSTLDPAEATVTEGDDPIDISADIENIGDQSGEQNIELSITNESGAVVYTDTLEDVELSGGEARTVTFEDAPAGDLTPGEYTHSVGTANETVAGTLLVVTANQPPAADAGENQTVEEGASVTLNAGGSSDPDGDALSYTWTQTAGPSISLSNPSAETPSFTAPDVDADSNLVFEVTVSDGNGGTATDTVTITVQNVTAPEPDNRPPSADAGEDQTVDERATVQLDADGSTDPDGDILTYNWTQTAGPSVTLSEPLFSAPTFTAPTVTEETTLTFRTRARDGNGGTDTDTVNITVLPVNDPPAADAGPDQTVDSGITVNLDASASTDPEGDSLSYEWEPVSRANVTLSDANTATPSFTASDVDVETILSFEVTVSDGNSGTDTDTVDIRIEPAEQPVENQPPIADAGADRTVPEEGTTTLDATGSSDPDGDSLAYTWTQTSGPDVTLSDANTATPSFTTPAVDQATDLTFEVTVNDGQGGTDTETVTVTVQPVTEGEAFFAVSDLNAPDEVAQGDQLTISATITNTGDAEGTQLIEARVDANRDGRQEVIQTESVTLASGESTTVTTTRTVPANLSTGTYTGGLFTFDSNQTTSVTVISAASPAENYTRDEIAQAKYGLNFSELSNETARQVEELYLRQPFADGAQPEDVKTREEIAEERYSEDFENLSRETTIEIQSDFDAQFGDTGGDAEYSRDEISRAKYYGYNFSELSTETAGQVEELHNRQPFADGLSPSDVQTREEIANENYGLDIDELSRETRLEVEQTYHEQFVNKGGEEE